MKYDWKKQEKHLYAPKKKAEIVTVPPQKFLTIKGEGNPNNRDFSERVGVLYPVAWSIKMGFKKFYKSHQELQSEFDYSEFAIFPLEGIWSTKNTSDITDKESFEYKIMLRQPDWITQEMFAAAVAAVGRKEQNQLLKELSFETIEDGKCIQILHHGSFDDEPASFQKMEQFGEENGLKRRSYLHREIYLNDARKTVPEKRRTILRYQVD
ncbi:MULTISPECIES: GyrI-like domain-containing protein [Enterococcus]|uniref:GyrI-like domain-containing protein n=1 Tax=Candidatus Enterococcus murrayae TaxID=2815321 RepID=A0ABS3HC11_9ENTE|nr:GyrI-like domain-containing protein [Enterococcus sp. MJM16]MBO0450987.1 GyrI-like domain-containing protein [Enterococcus sp. MJM16]